jgi:hypothetical protein
MGKMELPAPWLYAEPPTVSGERQQRCGTLGDVMKVLNVNILALVDHEGRPLTIDKPTTPANDVEEQQEDPLWVVAAREAAKQSTKVCTSK